jgi:hypothetical protein
VKKKTAKPAPANQSKTSAKAPAVGKGARAPRSGPAAAGPAKAGKKVAARAGHPTVYDKLACIVLAAGKGTRMKSGKAKVLHTIL